MLLEFTHNIVQDFEAKIAVFELFESSCYEKERIGFGIGFYKIRLSDWILNPDLNPIWLSGFGLDFKSKNFGLFKAL